MTSYYYKKSKKGIKINFLKAFAFFLILLGSSIIMYISFPLISWHLYFNQVFASKDLTTPIPKTTVVSKDTVKTLIESASLAFGSVDYTDARNWFPALPENLKRSKTNITSYKLTIQKLGIKDAIVSTTDYDLSRHLVHYGDTALPGDNGNIVIFGHSTLPQLFNPKDYKTIFATLYKLGINDEVILTADHVSYKYAIKNIFVVDPTETSVFSQDFDESYLTLVTCTPPGTTWKRLILRGKLAPIKSGV
ncbi:MAG: sortase [Candidatus Levyibacteriota bacterium]|nr:MAG: sortase [Candidatus Levybacteria bacterium]